MHSLEAPTRPRDAANLAVTAELFNAAMLLVAGLLLEESNMTYFPNASNGLSWWCDGVGGAFFGCFSGALTPIGASFIHESAENIKNSRDLALLFYSSYPSSLQKVSPSTSTRPFRAQNANLYRADDESLACTR